MLRISIVVCLYITHDDPQFVAGRQLIEARPRPIEARRMSFGGDSNTLRRKIQHQLFPFFDQRFFRVSVSSFRCPNITLNYLEIQMSKHVYEVRPRKDGHGFYLISERLPFGRLWYHKAADAVDDAKCYSR